MTDILITTAIAYANGEPHIGHSYEIILASFFKNIYLLQKNNVKLLTGTDEHGKKIQQTAEKNNLSPQLFCDINSKKFQELYDLLKINYDYFIRTSNDNHKQNVSNCLTLANENNKIYKTEYTGYYDITEEAFITEKEAEKNNFKNPLNNIPYIISKETIYKLKMLKEIQNMCIPSNCAIDERLNDINDLPITRIKSNVSWGIDVPFDNEHVTYVWFDALLNYITGCKILFNEKISSNCIPQIIHIIGKDIVWFHTAIYQSILSSCNLEKYMPKNIIIHGHIVDADGKKMSKSLDNGIKIETLLKKYSLTSIKYYLILSTILGEDFKFNEEVLINEYNNLLNNYGNLFQRLYKLMSNYQNEINNVIKLSKSTFNDDIDTILNNFLKIYDIQYYKTEIFTFLKKANLMITENQIWIDTENKINILVDVYLLFHKASYLLLPIINDDIIRLYSYLNINNITNELSTINIDITKKVIAFSKL